MPVKNRHAQWKREKEIRVANNLQLSSIRDTSSYAKALVVEPHNARDISFLVRPASHKGSKVIKGHN